MLHFSIFCHFWVICALHAARICSYYLTLTFHNSSLKLVRVVLRSCSPKDLGSRSSRFPALCPTPGATTGVSGQCHSLTRHRNPGTSRLLLQEVTIPGDRWLFQQLLRLDFWPICCPHHLGESGVLKFFLFLSFSVFFLHTKLFPVIHIYHFLKLPGNPAAGESQTRLEGSS